MKAVQEGGDTDMTMETTTRLPLAQSAPIQNPIVTSHAHSADKREIKRSGVIWIHRTRIRYQNGGEEQED